MAIYLYVSISICIYLSYLSILSIYYLHLSSLSSIIYLSIIYPSVIYLSSFHPHIPLVLFLWRALRIQLGKGPGKEDRSVCGWGGNQDAGPVRQEWGEWWGCCPGQSWFQDEEGRAVGALGGVGSVGGRRGDGGQGMGRGLGDWET